MKVDVVSPKGTKAGSAELPDDLFGIEPNVAVLHQVVNAQLAHRRAGTHSTKTRAEVAGGGAKPWRQKGTGRARHGSIRSPQWRGGGIAHGPKPRDYSEKTPKKMVRLALRSALSDRAAESRVKVVDSWGIDEPKTKLGIELLEGLGLRPKGERAPRVLVVLDRGEHSVWKSFRNLGERVQIVLPEELNPYDILLNDWIVFSKTTLDDTNARYAERSDAKPEPAKRAPAKAAAPKVADTGDDDAEQAPATAAPAGAASEAGEGDDA